MKKRASVAALAGLASILNGCVGPTELWVVVESNVRAVREDPSGMRAVQIEVSVDGEASPFFSQSHDLSATFALPGFKQIIAPRGQERRRARVVVTGTLADGTTVRQTAVAAFGAGRRLRLNMFLANECIGEQQTRCESMGETCGVDGDCVPVERTELPDFDGASGAALAACAAPRAAAPLVALPAPRLVGPTSGSVALSFRPRFRWANGAGSTGARVEVCADPGCSTVIAAFESVGTTVKPDCLLPRGTHFFRARARGPAGYGTETSRVWQVRIGANTGIPSALGGVDGDFDGDGLADIAYASASGIRLVRGVRGGAPVESPSVLSPMSASNVEFVGDLDGNGVSDLAAAGSAGIQLFFGARAGETAPMPVTIAPPAGVTGFGTSGVRTVAAGGDLNRDGYGDFLVGAPSAANGATSNAGAAFAVLSPFLGSMPTIVELGRGTRSVEGYGWSVAGANDLTGDGLPDVLISSPGAMLNMGAVYLVSFNGDRPTPPIALAPSLPMGNRRFGQFGMIFADVLARGRSSAIAGPNMVPTDLYVSELVMSTVRFSRRTVGPGKLTGVLREGDPTPGADLVCFDDASGGSVYVVGGGPVFDTSAAMSPIRPPTGFTMLDATASTGDMDGDGYGDFVQGLSGSALLFVRRGERPSAPTVVMLSAQPDAITHGQ